MQRMTLQKLTLSGDGKKEATLTFEKGLNVITGDSDTGKTFAFQCLNYILGADKPPKTIAEAKGYSLFALDFTVGDEAYRIERLWGSHKVDVIHGGEKVTLSCKHDPTNTKNLSRYLLQLLLGKDNNIYLKKNAANKKRSLSFRDIVHLCMVDETDIIAEASSFQSIQYQEKTVRKSILKYIITGDDDSDIAAGENAAEENIRRSGVVQFLEKKREILREKISEIDADANFKQYINSDSTKVMISRIKYIRDKISDSNMEVTRQYREIQRLNRECFSDEVKISEFEKLKAHYIDELEKNGTITDYADYLSQLPRVSCPVCGQLVNPRIINSNNSKELFEYLEAQSIELNNRVREISLSIEDVSLRLTKNKEQMRQAQLRIDELSEEIAQQERKLKTISKNIAIIRQLDEMKKSREIYQQELISVEGDIVAYSEKVKSQKSDSTSSFADYSGYCQAIETVLKNWGFSEDTKVVFDSESLDLLINGKERVSWGKGYRAFIMSAMVVGLMRYCYENGRLHPGFVVIDSPLVSLKERKLDESHEWIDDYLEQGMVEDILKEDCLRQVIIFENKDIKYDHNYHYVEFNHASDVRKGFIPSA